MKSLFKLTAALMVSALIFTSCNKTNDAGKMIPKNAMFIFHIDAKSMLGKLSYDEIKQTSWFKKIACDTTVPDFTKKLLDKPENSGIDIKEGFVIFGQRSLTQGRVVIEGSVKDAKLFEAFNKNFNATASNTKDGDINMMPIKEGVLVGWNDKKFAYVFNAPGMNSGMGGMGDDTLQTTPMGATSQLLQGFCKNLFSLKADSSMEKNEKFAALLKEAGDVHIWQNTEEIMKSSAQLSMLSMLKMDAFLNDNIGTYTISFDDGQLTVKQKWYVSKELTDILKKYSASAINTDMIKNIPSQDVAGLFAVSFKPEGLKEMIKLTGMDGMINIYTSQKGFTLDDFVAGINGDVVFSFSDLKMGTGSTDTAVGMVTTPKPSSNFLFATGIKDKVAFDKLISAGKKISEGKSQGVFYAKTDKLFAIGNTQDVLTRYVAGGNNKFDFLDKLKDHPVAAFVDIQKILVVVPAASMDSSEKIILAESQKTWNRIYMAGGEFKDGGMVSKTEILMMDKSTNSLKQLNKYFDVISKVMIAKEEKRKSAMNDTTIIVSPADSIQMRSHK